MCHFPVSPLGDSGLENDRVDCVFADGFSFRVIPPGELVDMGPRLKGIGPYVGPTCPLVECGTPMPARRKELCSLFASRLLPNLPLNKEKFSLI